NGIQAHSEPAIEGGPVDIHGSATQVIASIYKLGAIEIPVGMRLLRRGAEQSAGRGDAEQNRVRAACLLDAFDIERVRRQFPPEVVPGDGRGLPANLKGVEEFELRVPVQQLEFDVVAEGDRFRE